MKPTVCYISSASHSGSTVLDLLLTDRLQAIGLGEVASVLNNKQTNQEATHEQCACGFLMTQCPFWGQLPADQSEPSISAKQLIEKYRQVFTLVASVNQSVLIDSSKSLSALTALKELQATGECTLKVIYLKRDIRGWVTSMKHVARRDGDRLFLITLRRILNWVSINQEMTRYLSDNQLDYLPVQYENLVADTDAVVKRIRQFVAAAGNQSSFHQAFGNRAKNKFSPAEPLVLDQRWKNDWATRILVGLLSPGIFVYNWLLKM